MSTSRIRVVLKPACGEGTEIVDADSGERIEGVRAITIRAAVGEATTVTLELIGVEIDGDITALDDDFRCARSTPAAKQPA